MYKNSNILKIIIIIVILWKSSFSIEYLNKYCRLKEQSDLICTDLELFNNSLIIIKSINIASLKLSKSNNIKFLSEILNNSIRINSLDLSNIQPFFTFDYINKLDTLIQLNLSFNQILIIKEKQFDSLNKLQILDLSNNQIFFFETNAFLGLQNILELYLEKNHLFVILYE